VLLRPTGRAPAGIAGLLPPHRRLKDNGTPRLPLSDDPRQTFRGGRVRHMFMTRREYLPRPRNRVAARRVEMLSHRGRVDGPRALTHTIPWT